MKKSKTLSVFNKFWNDYILPSYLKCCGKERFRLILKISWNIIVKEFDDVLKYSIGKLLRLVEWYERVTFLSKDFLMEKNIGHCLYLVFQMIYK